MTGHKIYVRRETLKRLPVLLIKRSIRTALKTEGIVIPCEISVLIADDRGIQEINRKFRAKDEPTDVLSFPMLQLEPGEFCPDMNTVDPDTNLLPLGDIILSVDRVREQAQCYGHSTRQETAYLTVHSVLHLLGYDHVDEADEKRRMRVREDLIVSELGFR